MIIIDLQSSSLYIFGICQNWEDFGVASLRYSRTDQIFLFLILLLCFSSYFEVHLFYCKRQSNITYMLTQQPVDDSFTIGFSGSSLEVNL